MKSGTETNTAGKERQESEVSKWRLRWPTGWTGLALPADNLEEGLSEGKAQDRWIFAGEGREVVGQPEDAVGRRHQITACSVEIAGASVWLEPSELGGDLKRMRSWRPWGQVL